MLASAHATCKAAKGEPAHANLEEEFADCMAWLCTLANITGVDLEKAIKDKYFGADGGPKGEK